MEIIQPFFDKLNRILCGYQNKILYLHPKLFNMDNYRLNKIKVVLAEQGRTNKWLAEQIGRDPATVSKWCTNSSQPPLDAFVAIAKCLGVKMEELIRDTESEQE